METFATQADYPAWRVLAREPGVRWSAPSVIAHGADGEDDAFRLAETLLMHHDGDDLRIIGPNGSFCWDYGSQDWTA